MNPTESATCEAIYVVRDTASGLDIAVGHYPLLGQGLAFLASHVVGMQRISFELHRIGYVCHTGGVLRVEPCDRVYIMSASQAMLDSYIESPEDLLDPDEEKYD